jgi:hypothetical protein
MVRSKLNRVLPRVHVAKQCRIAWPDYEARGHTSNASYGGIAAEFPRGIKWRHQEAILTLLPEEITLRVRPVRFERRGRTTKVAFGVEGIETGGQEWERLNCLPRS